MRIEVILVLAMAVLSAMADIKRSFNVTQAMAKPREALDPPQSAKKTAYLRTTPEERRKLSVFPKNTLKFVATTKAPLKMINIELRRKHSVLLPKMAKEILVSSPESANTELPFKATTMYNFKPTRAPKDNKRFSNNPRFATTAPSLPLKRIPNVYRNYLYERNQDAVRPKINRPALFARKNLNNVNSEEPSIEQEPEMVLRKDSTILRQDKNSFNDEEEAESQGEKEDNYTSEEQEEEEEVLSQEEVEQRDFDENDQSVEIEAESTEKVVNSNHVQDTLKSEVEKIFTKQTTEKTITNQEGIVERDNSVKRAKVAIDEEVTDSKEELMIVRQKRNKLGQAVMSADVELNTEPLQTETDAIDKRSIIEEENVSPTVASIKYTGKELTLSNNTGFRNINA